MPKIFVDNDGIWDETTQPNGVTVRLLHTPSQAKLDQLAEAEALAIQNAEFLAAKQARQEQIAAEMEKVALERLGSLSPVPEQPIGTELKLASTSVDPAKPGLLTRVARIFTKKS
jgi:hypothetical protein